MAYCAVAMLAGCQQADEIEEMGDKLPMFMEASIGKVNAISRYSGDTPDAVKFKDNDKVGLSVNDGGFIQWMCVGGKWNPVDATVNWSDRDTPHEFIAFYPFVAGASKGSVPMPDLSVQDGTMDAVAACDFLVAAKTQSYETNGTVSFTGDKAFGHVSSLVVITLKGEGELASATITGLSISGDDILTLSTYSFDATGSEDDPKVIVSEESGKRKDLLELFLEHSMDSKNKTYYFVLNSGTVDLEDVTLSVKYKKTDDSEYVATLEGLGTTEVTSFESGKQYSYSLKVAGGALIVSGNEIAKWGEGLALDDIVINGKISGGSQNED